MYLLSINDVALTLRSQNQLLYNQPAQALYTKERGLVFGDEASSASRLHPLDSNSSYLNTLSTEPLPRPLGDARNYADLVYQHLLGLVELTGELPVCLGVSASFNRDQLAILLGIAKEARLQISAFVDSAVLAASALPSQGKITYLDVQAQQLTLTRLEHDTQVRRLDQQVVLGAGAQGIVDGWINVVADRFVQATRFDPLHSASSEQQLYNQLNQWRFGLAAPAANRSSQNGELAIDIDLGSESRRALINEAHLLQKTAQRLAVLDEALSPSEHVVLSPLAQALPGLWEHLQQRQQQVQQLTDEHVNHALAVHPELFSTSDSVRMLVELDVRPLHEDTSSPATPVAESRPSSPPVMPAEASPAVTSQVLATHLLKNGLARPIDECLLDTQLPIARSANSFRVMPSESPLLDRSGDQLQVGDVLPTGLSFRWQSDEYQLIAVNGP
ncbi:MAG: hypothetical protein ACR2PZ_14830 [Pseudomonadales bacterium]